MRLGIHKQTLSAAVAGADQVFWYQNAAIDWDINAVASACAVPATAVADIDSLLTLVTESISQNTEIVIMSNGGFEGFHSRLVERISACT